MDVCKGWGDGNSFYFFLDDYGGQGISRTLYSESDGYHPCPSPELSGLKEVTGRDPLSVLVSSLLVGTKDEKKEPRPARTVHWTKLGLLGIPVVAWTFPSSLWFYLGDLSRCRILENPVTTRIPESHLYPSVYLTRVPRTRVSVWCGNSSRILIHISDTIPHVVGHSMVRVECLLL